jgi:hypothetical protein
MSVQWLGILLAWLETWLFFPFPATELMTDSYDNYRLSLWKIRELLPRCQDEPNMVYPKEPVSLKERKERQAR